jgi:hypothetical protein
MCSFLDVLIDLYSDGGGRTAEEKNDAPKLPFSFYLQQLHRVNRHWCYIFRGWYFYIVTKAILLRIPFHVVFAV